MPRLDLVRRLLTTTHPIMEIYDAAALVRGRERGVFAADRKAPAPLRGLALPVVPPLPSLGIAVIGLISPSAPPRSRQGRCRVDGGRRWRDQVRAPARIAAPRSS